MNICVMCTCVWWVCMVSVCGVCRWGVCICVCFWCVFEYECVMCVHGMNVCVWRMHSALTQARGWCPELTVSMTLFNHFNTLVFGTGCLTDPRACCVGQSAWEASLPMHLSLPPPLGATMLRFFFIGCLGNKQVWVMPSTLELTSFTCLQDKANVFCSFSCFSPLVLFWGSI